MPILSTIHIPLKLKIREKDILWNTHANAYRVANKRSYSTKIFGYWSNNVIANGWTADKRNDISAWTDK